MEIDYIGSPLTTVRGWHPFSTFLDEEGIVHRGLVDQNGPFAPLFLLGLHRSFF
jgi:hypothetical protein